MKKIFIHIIIFTILFISCINNILAKEQLNDYLITFDRAGDIFIGMSYKEFIKKHPSFKKLNSPCNSDEPKGLFIFKYILVSDNACNKLQIIKKIDIFSPKFKFENNIKVGMHILDFIKIYPNSRMRKDTLTQEEYFEITNNKKQKIIFYLRHNNADKVFQNRVNNPQSNFDPKELLLGEYDDIINGKLAKNFKLNGKINSISIQ